MSSAVKPRVKLLCLAGFMGSGKTTAGRQLAQQIGWRFLDLDERIEQRAGSRIAEIFERLGESAFRDLEYEQLGRALEESTSGAVPSVIALGGGTFAQARNLELLRTALKPEDAPREGFVIWLDCPVDQLFARCVTMGNRPLFRDESSFRELYEDRVPFYRMADFRVESAGEPRAVVERILALGIVDQGSPTHSEVNA
ncbi:MAG TPA: shikimate kinase [Candidatus Acidoferrales bacterium]|nr:shikimate kinase [Candidatus Acidoferrales bacterium]